MKFKRAGAALLMALTAGLLFTGNALAHALLVRSLPAANSELLQSPATIELWFSEPVEADFSSAQILNTSGDELPVGSIVLDPNDSTHLSMSIGNLTPGIYSVAWKTLSRTDGHEGFGSFPFTVLNPDGSRPSEIATAPGIETSVGFPTLMQTIARWLALMGGILFVSIPLFLVYVTSSVGKDSRLENRLNTLGIKIAGLGVFAILIGSWLQVALQATQLDNLKLLPGLIFGTHIGSLALIRQTLTLGGFLVILKLPQPFTEQKRQNWVFSLGVILEVCLILFTVLSGIKGEWLLAAFSLIIICDVWGMAWYIKRTYESTSRQLWILVLLLGSTTLFLFSSGSHAGAVPGRFWAVISDFIHLLATSAWVGGLMLLPLMLEQLRREGALDKSVLGPLFRRYGYMAKFSFFLLITTGLFNSLVHFPTWISLFNTVYGQVLLIKLVFVILVWWISLRSSQVLRRPGGPSGISANLPDFNRQVALAALTSLLLMVAVAALVQTQPPVRVVETPLETASVFHTHVQGDDLEIALIVIPYHVGDNKFRLYLSHADNSSVGDVQLVRLLFNYQEAQIGQSSTDMNQLDTGLYGVDGAFLNQPGNWKVSIYVRRRGMNDVIVDTAINMPVPENAIASAEPFQNPTPNTPFLETLSGAMILIGFELYRWRKTLEQVQPKLFPIFKTMAFILFGAGVILLIYVSIRSGIILLPRI